MASHYPSRTPSYSIHDGNHFFILAFRHFIDYCELIETLPIKGIIMIISSMVFLAIRFL